MDVIKNKFIKTLWLKKETHKSSDCRSLFISAFPKSGSSFILLVIINLLKYSRGQLIYSFLREQDLYEPFLKAHSKKNIISKHHTLATDPNVKLFKKYNIEPIILTRNLPDTVISLRDHISESLQWPHFIVPQDFNTWKDEVQFDFLIDLAIPWYIFFYVSWKKTQKQELLKVKFFNYEIFHKNKAETILEITNYWGYEYTLADIIESMDEVSKMSTKENRVNKGVMNRGAEYLSKSQVERIIALTKHYPDIDFSSIL